MAQWQTNKSYVRSAPMTLNDP